MAFPAPTLQHDPRVADLRADVARVGVRKFEVADAAGMTPVALSLLLSGRKPLTPELERRIRTALAQLREEIVRKETGRRVK